VNQKANLLYSIRTAAHRTKWDKEKKLKQETDEQSRVHEGSWMMVMMMMTMKKKKNKKNKKNKNKNNKNNKQQEQQEEEEGEQ